MDKPYTTNITFEKCFPNLSSDDMINYFGIITDEIMATEEELNEYIFNTDTSGYNEEMRAQYIQDLHVDINGRICQYEIDNLATEITFAKMIGKVREFFCSQFSNDFSFDIIGFAEVGFIPCVNIGNPDDEFVFDLGNMAGMGSYTKHSEYFELIKFGVKNTTNLQSMFNIDLEDIQLSDLQEYIDLDAKHKEDFVRSLNNKISFVQKILDNTPEFKNKFIVDDIKDGKLVLHERKPERKLKNEQPIKQTR